MLMNRTTRGLAAWLAIVAMLLATLAPAVSHALASGSDGTIEICSVDGPRTISSPDAPAPLPHNALEHCPYCFTQANSVALPSAPLPMFGAPSGPLAAVAAIAPARPARTVPLAARPRAPPFSS